MQCFVADPTGVLVASAVEPCPGFMVLTASEAAAVIGQVTMESVAQIGVTPESLALAFTFGFGMVLSIVWAAYPVAVVIAMLRRV